MNLRGALAIFKDELHRFFRTVFGSILSPVLTTSLYLVVFGAAIGSRMDPAQFGGASYGAFIVPGLIMLTLLCGGIFHSLAGRPLLGWLALHNEHVAWEGTVYWDLIQPAFMFMVGVAMPFAFAARARRGDTWARQAQHAVRRAALLVVIGVLLDHVGAGRVQIGFIRVLQQIAFGYLGAFLVLGRPVWAQALTVLLILVGYQLLWMFNPWNGPGGPWAQGRSTD